MPAGVIGALVTEAAPRTRTTVLVIVTATTWPEEVSVTVWGSGVGPQANEASTRPPTGGVSVMVHVEPTGMSPVEPVAPAARSNVNGAPSPQSATRWKEAPAVMPCVSPDTAFVSRT